MLFTKYQIFGEIIYFLKMNMMFNADEEKKINFAENYIPDSVPFDLSEKKMVENIFKMVHDYDIHI